MTHYQPTDAVQRATADMDYYAPWASRFEGRAVGLGTPVDGGGGERPQREDEKGHAWHRAAEINRRLRTLTTGAGCTHVAVLEWVRNHGPHYRASSYGGFLAALGTAHASREQRAWWASRKGRALGQAGAAMHGAALLDAAAAAYCATLDSAPNLGKPTPVSAG